MDLPKNILIVEDDAASASLYADFLTEKGFEVRVVPNSETCKQEIANNKPDLVLLDLVLPGGKSGFEICSYLKGNPATHDLPIIICTARGMTITDKIRGFDVGADDYMVKPFDMVELLARIKALLRRTRVQPKTELLAGLQAMFKAPEPVTAPTPPGSPHPMRRKTDHAAPKEALPPPPKPVPLKSFERYSQLLIDPYSVFRSLQHDWDFFFCLAIVVASALMESIPSLMSPTDNLNGWGIQLSLGLLGATLSWIALGGLLNLTLPFLGTSLTMKQALIYSGMGWGPKLLGAFFSAVYSVCQLGGFSVGKKVFSSGIDLIPFLPLNSTTFVLGRIGLFDIWSSAIVLIGVWAVVPSHNKKWNPIVILIGWVGLMLGFLNGY